MPARPTSAHQDIRIIGGGAAGLSLAIALGKLGVISRVQEASTYPRHRMCGEFLTGISDDDLATLGLKKLFAASPLHRESVWFDSTGEIFRRALPSKAYGVSRYALDQQLAANARRLGCAVEENTRWSSADEDLCGTIIATGRRINRDSSWIGMKAHFHNLPTESDLEMHLAENAYVGVCAVDQGAVTVCGLFHSDHAGGGAATPSAKLSNALERCGLPELARRVGDASFVEGSLNGVSHVSFGIQEADTSVRDGALHLGDSFAITPPFTGNGIAMALRSGIIAAPHIASYAYGERSWQDARDNAESALIDAFKSRINWAKRLQPVLTSSLGKSALRVASKARLLPFRKIFQLTHG